MIKEYGLKISDLLNKELMVDDFIKNEARNLIIYITVSNGQMDLDDLYFLNKKIRLVEKKLELESKMVGDDIDSLYPIYVEEYEIVYEYIYQINYKNMQYRLKKEGF